MIKNYCKYLVDLKIPIKSTLVYHVTYKLPKSNKGN